MIIIRLFVVLLLGILAACSSHVQIEDGPILSSINLIDRDGLSETISTTDRLKQFEQVDFCRSQPYQKVLRNYSRDANGDTRAYITSYHPNGNLKQYLEVVNNRAYGKYQEFHENGKMKLDAFIIGGTADIDTGAEQTWLFDGTSYAWDEEGNILAEIPYANGQLEGVSLYYHKNGNIWKHIPCSKGKTSGIMTVYFPDGELFQSVEYVDGLKHGISSRYWNGRKIASEEIYRNGSLTSGKYYDRNNKIISEIKNGTGNRVLFAKDQVSEIQEYKNGSQEGTVKIYDAESNLASMHNVKNEVKHGEEVEYFVGTTKPKLSISWVEGKIQGPVKTWYPNGAPESRREMSNNVKNGLLSAWYKDGSLMLIEEYDNDQLVRGEYYAKGDKTPVSSVNFGQGTATLYDGDGGFLRKVMYNHGKPER